MRFAEILACALLAAGAGQAQDATEPLFRSELTLVQVDLEVSIGDHGVDGLRQEDFRVLDGGKPQPIVYFAHSEQPLDVILLLDTSYSMQPTMLQLAETARDSIRALRGGDRIAVMAFDSGTTLMLDFSSDLSAVERDLWNRVLARPYTPDSKIQRAVDDAALHFLKQPRASRRRAVVIVTDDQGSLGWPRALRDLWEADAVLYGLVIEARPASFVGRPQDGIQELVARTGGDVLRTFDVRSGFQSLMEHLRLRYSLQYAMPAGKPGQEGKIKVELTKDAQRQHPSAKIRARSGYVVPNPNPRPNTR